MISGLRALALLPCLVLTVPKDESPVPMRDVRIRGNAAATAEGGTVNLLIQATIGTPLGRLPFSSHLELRYDCSAHFRGRMSYSPLVRLFAKLKGVDLIRSVDGVLQADSTRAVTSCSAMQVGSITGTATADARALRGHLRLDGDSVEFRGPAWMAGDTSYHSVLAARRGDRELQLRVNMYER